MVHCAVLHYYTCTCVNTVCTYRGHSEFGLWTSILQNIDQVQKNFNPTPEQSSSYSYRLSTPFLTISWLLRDDAIQTPLRRAAHLPRPVTPPPHAPPNRFPLFMTNVPVVYEDREGDREQQAVDDDGPSGRGSGKVRAPE